MLKANHRYEGIIKKIDKLHKRRQKLNRKEELLFKKKKKKKILKF
jgi:hypothetical protein